MPNIRRLTFVLEPFRSVLINFDPIEGYFFGFIRVYPFPANFASSEQISPLSSLRDLAEMTPSMVFLSTVKNGRELKFFSPVIWCLKLIFPWKEKKNSLSQIQLSNGWKSHLYSKYFKKLKSLVRKNNI